MAAQVELEAVRPCVVGSRLHLSPLIDSSNKNFMDSSGGPQGSVIISSEPRKPIPAPKPRLSPKPFTVEKNPTIRPILAPKPQPKPRNESTLPTFYKPDLPSALKPQSTGKPGPTLGSSNWSSGLKTGQTNKTQSFKPALPFTCTDSNKSTQNKDVLKRKSFGAALANTKSGLHSSNTNAEWPFPSQTRQPGSNITRAKSLGFLSEVGLNYEENKQDDTRTENEIKRTPTVLRPQYKGSRPRPVSAVFAPCPTQPETQVGSSTPVPHWVERRPLSSDLTSKFGSTGLSTHRQHSRSDCKENTPASCAGRETRGENAESQNKFLDPVTGSIKAEPKEDDSTKAFKPEDEGGSSIKKRISLLLDSSSSYSAQTDAQVMDQRLSAQTTSESDGKVGVKQRIKELSEEAPAAPTPPQRPQYKPRQLHSDRGKRFEADLDHLKSTELKEAIDSDDGFKTKSECSSDDGQLSKQEDSKASSLFVDGLSTNSGLYNTGVQTVRAAVFEHVVERHSVHVMEDNITQASQKETRIKPMPRRNHSLRIRGDPLMGADDGDPYSLVKATYREQVSPSSPKRVDHVFDMVSLSGESRAVSEALPVAQLEDKALTLRSRRSASQSELDKSTPEVNQRFKDVEIKAFVPLVDTRNPRFLRVGALPKWPEGNREIDIDRERQKEMVRKMEEDIQRQVELHKVRVADLEEDEKHGEPEWMKGMDAHTGRQREHEAGKHIQSKTLNIEDQINKPRATYFALTGQIQEPVYQGEKMDETSEKWWMLDSEERGIKDKDTFDDFIVKTVQWASQNPISLFQRNSSLDAAMQRDLSEEQLGTNVGQRTEHSLKQREPKQVKDELEIERTRLAELEKMRHLEMELEIKKQQQKEIESEKRREIESQKEKKRQKDLERQQELERRREVERQKREKERQKQVDYERIKAAERELEQQREFERRRQKEIEREKQRMLDQEMLRIMEYERQRDMEREKERQLELERRREVERQRQKELEKQREIERQKESERQKFLERQQQLEKQKEVEKERQRQMERQQELNRKREIERQRELEREQERQKELERQKQRERELDRYKQQKADEREKKRELEELERIKELERQQLLDYELQKHRQQEQEKKRTKQKREREVQQPEGQQRAETTKRTPTSPLRPKVLDLDSVSLGVRPGQSSLDISPTARWKQPLLHPDEVYKPAILDIDSFQSQADLITGFGSLGSGVGLGTQSRSQSITTSPQNFLQPPIVPQASFQPSDLMRLQLPPPLQPQVLHKSQPNSLQFGVEKPKAQPQSLMEFGIKQPVSSLPYMQTNIWGTSQSELAVDEPLWVSTMEGSRRPISTRPSGPDSHFLGQDDKGFISTSTSASSVSPVFLSSLHPQAQTTVPSQTPAPQTGQPVFHPILTPERCWPSGPLNAGSSAALSHFSAGPSARIDVPISRIDVPISSSQGNKISVADPIWSPNWELVSQGPRENRTSHRDKVQQKRSRSMCRRSAPTDGSTDEPVVLVKTRRSRSAHKERHGEDTDLVEKCVGGQQQHKDTDNLVQETDSQYGTWETGLHTDDSLSATPSSECIITPSPRKPSPPQTTEQNLLIDVPDCSAASPPKQTDLLFPETPTTLLDSSALRARVSLNKRSTRRAPPSRTTRHSSALSQVLEGSAAEEEEDWRFKDSTEEKAESKPAPESDSEEQAKGIDTRTSSVSQAQRVALFPGMDSSALKVQLKKRGESDHQTDGPSPTPLPRSPKSPFLPRASRVLPPVGGKENGEESSPQWLKELKTKKRLSQYESDNTA